jgi:muramoyltetrapeptide carboxypeptidase LdcA involved in peptidoglycan recycling
MNRLKRGDQVGIISCSNGISVDNQNKIKELQEVLCGMGLVPVMSSCVMERGSVFAGSARERGEALMRFYTDDKIRAIFDVSGGDIANEILPYLDFFTIASADKPFWGYSDLTTILNAIYAKTGRESVLYQVRNLVRADGAAQQKAFHSTMLEGTEQLFEFETEFVQGNHMEGVVAGGNIRCLLKLAGTPYWPDLNGHILLLESWGGRVPQMVTFLNQLKQIGVFDQVSGILLGTFTTMQAEHCEPDIAELTVRYAGSKLPIARTWQIGHGSDSCAIRIGHRMELWKRQ